MEYCVQRYNESASMRGRMSRDIDSLKGKFEKLANTKQRTGDPSCPLDVRRAKHIAREMLSRVNAQTVRRLERKTMTTAMMARSMWTNLRCCHGVIQSVIRRDLTMAAWLLQL